MKAALCKTLDGPQALTIEDIAPPLPKSGQALVRVTAVGLNFADTLITKGKYQFKPELPFAPGAEIAGVIELPAAGSPLQAGQRVTAYVGWGGAAELVAVDADMLVPVPDAVPDAIAAGLTVTYGTAIHGLKDRGRVQPGETCVVTGAAGGAGQAAVEVAALMGARVIAVASSPEKIALAREAGASDGIVYPGSDLKTAVRDLTGGKGADVIYDCIGGDAAEPLLRALTWQGRFLVVGFAAGEIPKIPLNLLLVKGVAALGVFWGEAIRRDPKAHRDGMAELLGWVAAGKLKPRTHAVYAMESIRDALAVLESRSAQGKLIVTL